MRFLQWFGNQWCELTHPAPRWPVNGFRECPRCLRRHRIAWESEKLPSTRQNVGAL
jgi:hypothetical protein